MKTFVGKPLGAACAVVLGTLLTACSAPAAGEPAAAHHAHAAPPAAAAKPATAASIDQIGAALGCPSPDVQIDADELRQAVCRTSAAHSVLVTFTTGKGQRDWLDAAQPYGGTYLVGERWVVVSDPAVLEGLRTKLGGAIESTQHH
ncbi:hypothetical protein AB0K05_12485 [Nonomuraea sp. NPDC049486]|uniref:hypothetical protein n=1 Tax=Nonomuraea sp. NPDC049486 TaxID=3155773 RepID=UPI003419B56F